MIMRAADGDGEAGSITPLVLLLMLPLLFVLNNENVRS